MKSIYIAVLAFALSVMPAVLAETEAKQDPIDAVLEDFLSAKKRSVAQHADLSSAEAEAFWPLYGAYEEAMRPVLHDVMSLLARYQKERSSISEADASVIIDALVRSSERSIEVQSAYLKRFRAILPATKVLDISAVLYGSPP